MATVAAKVDIELGPGIRMALDVLDLVLEIVQERHAYPEDAVELLRRANTLVDGCNELLRREPAK